MQFSIDLFWFDPPRKVDEAHAEQGTDHKQRPDRRIKKVRRDSAQADIDSAPNVPQHIVSRNLPRKALATDDSEGDGIQSRWLDGRRRTL